MRHAAFPARDGRAVYAGIEESAADGRPQHGDSSPKATLKKLVFLRGALQQPQAGQAGIQFDSGANELVVSLRDFIACEQMLSALVRYVL